MPSALIAEDEPMLRAQLKARLAEAWPELTTIAEAENGEQALARGHCLHAQIHVLVQRIPHGN